MLISAPHTFPMNNESIENPQVYKANNKRNILIALAILQVASTLAQWLLVFSENAFLAATIFAALGFTVGVLIWCHIDARERGISLGGGFRILMILVMPVALIYYLFKSRGFAGGLVSIGWSIGFFIVLIVVNVVVNLLLAAYLRSTRNVQIGRWNNLKRQQLNRPRIRF